MCKFPCGIVMVMLGLACLVHADPASTTLTLAPPASATSAVLVEPSGAGGGEVGNFYLDTITGTGGPVGMTSPGALPR